MKTNTRPSRAYRIARTNELWWGLSVQQKEAIIKWVWSRPLRGVIQDPIPVDFLPKLRFAEDQATVLRMAEEFSR